MAQKYITLSEEALDKLLSLVRESHSVAEGIDDINIATNSTYSSQKIEELLGEAGADGAEIEEITYEQYLANKEEYDASDKMYWINDYPNVEGEVQTAEQTPFDDTTSQLGSDNVQGAIDNLQSMIEENTENIDALKNQSWTLLGTGNSMTPVSYSNLEFKELMLEVYYGRQCIITTVPKFIIDKYCIPQESIEALLHIQAGSYKSSASIAINTYEENIILGFYFSKDDTSNTQNATLTVYYR